MKKLYNFSITHAGFCLLRRCKMSGFFENDDGTNGYYPSLLDDVQGEGFVNITHVDAQQIPIDGTDPARIEFSYDRAGNVHVFTVGEESRYERRLRNSIENFLYDIIFRFSFPYFRYVEG